MPRPRFQNLAEEKRLALIDSAAKEFAQHGYENASINRILENAGMSKGAAYYYFDDKADVFMTVVQYYTEVMVTEFSLELREIDAANFWHEMKRLYVQQILLSMDEPWRAGVVKAVFSLSEEARQNTNLDAYFSRFMGAILEPIERGQKLGVIRSDIPQSLLINLLTGFDTAIDTWFAQYGNDYPRAEAEKYLKIIAESLEELLKSRTNL